jgi:hypothetical protein
MFADPDHDFIAGFRDVVVSQDKSVGTYYDAGSKAHNLAVFAFLAVGSGVIGNAKEAAEHRISGKGIGLLLDILGGENGDDAGAYLFDDWGETGDRAGASRESAGVDFNLGRRRGIGRGVRLIRGVLRLDRHGQRGEADSHGGSHRGAGEPREEGWFDAGVLNGPRVTGGPPKDR